MATFARERDMMFVPCVAPGYDDSKIRPWNRANRRDREEGDYYQRAWQAALASKAIYVGAWRASLPVCVSASPALRRDRHPACLACCGGQSSGVAACLLTVLS